MKIKNVIIITVCIILLIGVVYFFVRPKETNKTFTLWGKGNYTEADLLEGAKKEGEVIYCTDIPSGTAEKIAKTFETKYGIKAEIIRGSPANIAQKFYAEKEKNITPSCDVITIGFETFSDWKSKGWIEKVSNLDGWDKFPSKYKDDDGYFVDTRIDILSMIYNSKLLKPEEVPKSLKELTDPKWKDKVITADPAVSGGALVWARWIVQLPGFGWDYLAKLKDNNIAIVDQHGAVMDAVATGKKPIGISMGDTRYAVAKTENASIEWVYPIEGFIVEEHPSAIPTDTTHPYAARLLMIYLMSEDGQLAHVENGLASAREGINYIEKNPFMRPLEEGWMWSLGKVKAEESQIFIANVTKVLRGK